MLANKWHLIAVGHLQKAPTANRCLLTTGLAEGLLHFVLSIHSNTALHLHTQFSAAAPLLASESATALR
jgi:hypothetical protein